MVSLRTNGLWYDKIECEGAIGSSRSAKVHRTPSLHKPFFVDSVKDKHMQQLTLFDRPEIYFDECVRATRIDGIPYWSVLDVFAHYGNKSNPTKAWEYVRNYLEKQGFESSNFLLEHQFPGQGQRKTPVANLEGFMRIAQVTEFKHWEHLRELMALVGAGCIRNMAQHNRTIEMQRYERAGLGDRPEIERLRLRDKSINTYKELHATIGRICQDARHGQITNSEYVSLFRQTTKQLRELLNTKEIRNELPHTQLMYLSIAENQLNEYFTQHQSMTNDDVLQVIAVIVEPLGDHLHSVSELLGLHPVTNQPLLNGGI